MSVKTVPEPSTLAELKELSGDELRSIDAYQRGDSLSIKSMIRAIIRLENAETEWQGVQKARSLREFWYNPVKPVMERAFSEKLAEDGYDFTRRMSQRLSEELSEMVKNGDVTYRGMNILDDSRKRSISPQSLEHDKILFVEKDAAYRKLTPLADVYELSVVSGSGWQSTACIEDIAATFDSEGKAGAMYHIYVLSDYDPTGFNIAQDFSDRSKTLDVPVAAVERIGINPDQLDGETLDQQRFSPPINSDNDERWLAEHGIADEYGLEIEALSGQDDGGRKLRQIVVDVLRPEIRARERIKADLDDATGEMINKAVGLTVNELTRELRSALHRAARDHLTDETGIDDLRDIPIETARDHSNHLPAPISEDDYHETAIDGREHRTPRTRTAKVNLYDHLKAQLMDGEIDIENLLDLNKDSDE